MNPMDFRLHRLLVWYEPADDVEHMLACFKCNMHAGARR